MSFRLEGNGKTSNAAPHTDAGSTAAMVAAGLALQANMHAGQPDPVVHDSVRPVQPVRKASSRSVTRSRIRRKPARVERRPRAAGRRTDAALQAADEQRSVNTELRDWLKENAAAQRLLVEMHHQWPEDTQLHMFRRASFPRNHSRRMTTCAVLMQLATVLFAAWATLTNPLILFPLAAFAIFVAFRQWYFLRFPRLPARMLGIAIMVLVLVLSELLMAIVWASFTGGHITIVFGDRPAT